ncbi:SAM-dependent methyltransferase [Prauserella muralis]|uniref:Polyketide biosynthesis methyltransferase n=1 Tax=Prauserella muralis TaxID=588067 RepID=A0A2V4ARR5_9PSEU|nr:SAM-dependent methyltransferase [Prauserella muralis]PXY22221.1 polyketide biosynthesis methyltransferase [Prauserella muralis]TWE27853.1 S-adenosyl methyltransferase [Prauserella muralis]
MTDARSSDDRLRDSVDRPSSARVYDYILGGTHHYAIDRDFAERQLAIMPEMRLAMQANRAFLGRAVRYAVDQGVRQFVDIGSGLPTVGNVHEVADEAAPGQCRVVYVDNEPIARAHAEILLADTADPDRHRALLGDFFDHARLWDEIVATGLIDRTRPTCLLVVGILHFMPPERDPEASLAFYRERLAPGSLLVLSHGSRRADDAQQREVERNYQQTTNRMHLRTAEEFLPFFGDWTLAEPGIVPAARWRPDAATRFADDPDRAPVLAGVARKGGDGSATA